LNPEHKTLGAKGQGQRDKKEKGEGEED